MWPRFRSVLRQDCFACDEENGASRFPVWPGQLVPVCDKHLADIRDNGWQWTRPNGEPYASAGEMVDLGAGAADKVAK